MKPLALIVRRGKKYPLKTWLGGQRYNSLSHIYSFDNISRGMNNPLKSQVYIANYERYDVLNSAMFASFEYQDNFFFNVGGLQFSGRFGQ